MKLRSLQTWVVNRRNLVQFNDLIIIFAGAILLVFSGSFELVSNVAISTLLSPLVPLLVTC